MRFIFVNLSLAWLFIGFTNLDFIGVQHDPFRSKLSTSDFSNVPLFFFFVDAIEVKFCELYQILPYIFRGQKQTNNNSVTDTVLFTSLLLNVLTLSNEIINVHLCCWLNLKVVTTQKVTSQKNWWISRQMEKLKKSVELSSFNT